MTSSVITSKCLTDLVIRGSNKFFRVMDIITEFLRSDPGECYSDESYIATVRRVENLQVINDFANRDVAIMQQFNLSLTKTGE